MVWGFFHAKIDIFCSWKPFTTWNEHQIEKLTPLLLLQLFELMEWKWSYFFDWRQFSPWNQPLKLSVRHKNTKCSNFPKNWSFSTKLFTSTQYLILSKYSDTCPIYWTRRVSNAQKDRLYVPYFLHLKYYIDLLSTIKICASIAPIREMSLFP